MDRTSVFIVEDEAIVAQDLSESLQSLGYQVSGIVNTGEKAIHQVPRARPDLVLMDINLAGSMDGIEAAERIHQDQKIPVIFLSAYADHTLLDRAKRTLPYGYIIKPFDERSIQSAIEMAIYKAGMEARIFESEKKYRTLFENMINGFCYLRIIRDRNENPNDCEYLDANPVFLHLFGLSEIIGKKFLKSPIFEEAAMQDLFSCYIQVGRTGRSETLEIQNPVQSLWLRVVVSCPIRDHIVAVFENITESKLASEALRRANHKLNLLASITRHDICNQLQALQGYFELLEMCRGDEEKTLELISKGAHVARTIERQIIFTKEYQDLGVKDAVWHALPESVRTARDALPMDGISVHQVNLTRDVYADPLFEKVFYNLLENALRYGGSELSAVTISAWETKKHNLVITVEDDGKGIDERDRPHLFKRGFGKHTGLGLFLSREILTITGIAINEIPGNGTGARFEITVPEGAWRKHHESDPAQIPELHGLSE